MNSLYQEAVVSVVSNAVTAGTTAVTTSALNMAGFDAVTYVAVLGTVTDGSVLTLTAYENTANSNSGGTAVTGGATASVTASSSSNTQFVVDVIRQADQYSYATLTRTTDNAVVNCILAIQYRAKVTPVTQPASVVGNAISSPEH